MTALLTLALTFPSELLKELAQSGGKLRDVKARQFS